MSSGQAFSAGRGGLESPLPQTLTSGGLVSPQLGGAAGVRAEPRDWPLGVGPALSPRLWSRQRSRLGPTALQAGAELGASARQSVVFWGSLGSWECGRKTQLVQLALGASHCSVSPPEGTDFVWLDEADFSMGKDIPTARDECGLSLETVSPAWMFQSRLWHEGRATLWARLAPL